MDNNTNTNEETSEPGPMDDCEVAEVAAPALTPEGKMQQLEESVEFWKRRSREESPSALYQELSRVRRACVHIANMTDEARVMQTVEESVAVPQTRAHPALRISGRGRASFSPDLLVGKLRQVHRVASSALSDKPSRVRVPSRFHRKANDEQK